MLRAGSVRKAVGLLAARLFAGPAMGWLLFPAFRLLFGQLDWINQLVALI